MVQVKKMKRMRQHCRCEHNWSPKRGTRIQVGLQVGRHCWEHPVRGQFACLMVLVRVTELLDVTVGERQQGLGNLDWPL